MGLTEEQRRAYEAARRSAVLMDRSACGRVMVTGEHRLDFLQRMSTNDFRDRAPGDGLETVLTSDIGRIVDHVTVYVQPDALLMVTSPGSVEPVMGWLRRYILFRDRVKLADVTAETGLLTLYGPQARAIVQMALDLPLGDVPVHHFRTAGFSGGQLLVAPAEGLGQGAVNLVIAREQFEPLKVRLLSAGQPCGLVELDTAVFEVLRVEAGLPAYGRELSESYNPLEANLSRAVSFNKGCYIGQEVIARLDTYDKVKQRLVGLRLDELPAGQGPWELTKDGRPAGQLTTALPSPRFGPIGLGYAGRAWHEPGTEVTVIAEAGPIRAEVAPLPFGDTGLTRDP